MSVPETPAETTLWAKHALTEDGWRANVSVQIASDGKVCSVQPDHPACGDLYDLLIPAVANLHSHAFQRAMAGMTETRGPDPGDSFWSWRKLMYRFLQHLTPDDIESIAAFGQMEMLEAGYASVGEFHYLHHQADGRPYAELAEMCERIIAAAEISGIGLTLLPVLYEQGGCDGRPLSGGQKRFGNTLDRFASLHANAQSMIKNYKQMSIGVAPHSLRAVSQHSLTHAVALASGQPLHIHIAEQDAEVKEIQQAWQANPVEWLLDNQAVDQRWCLVHATQMEESETLRLDNTQAVVGLCPITESNLGDGIFNGVNFHSSGGLWGVGTDSNVRISLTEELRTLEYSQRLQHKARSVYADEHYSTGRVLMNNVLHGGAQALQRNTGSIGVGRVADLIALDAQSPALIAVENDQWLDAWIFAGDDSLVTDVWSAGDHLVCDGQHRNREQITQRYRNTLLSIKTLL